MLFAYRLAAELGNPDPHAMLAQMPGSTFAGWREYANAEPFGAPARELAVARILALVHSAFRGPNTPAKRVADFYLLARAKVKQTPAQMWAIVKAAASEVKNAGVK